MSKFGALEITFDKEYLNKLTQDPGNRVCKQNGKYRIGLHPAQLVNLRELFENTLSRKIAKYDDKYKGIILGYEDIKLHFEIDPYFFIFKPKIGMILKGLVTETTRDYVRCLVYGTCTILLAKPQDVDGWLGNKACIQSEVIFKIIYIHLNACLSYDIRGELLDLNELSSKNFKKLNKNIIFKNGEIKFDKNYLNKLTQDPGTGVCKQNCKYRFAFDSAQFTNFDESIEDELRSKIAKYDDRFQGIMLGYENHSLLHFHLGVMGIEDACLHMDLLVDFFIFKPEIGMILKGMVTKKTRDYVGCLVYGSCNISLPKPQDADDSWLGNAANIENVVELKIIYTDLNTPLPYIQGELLVVGKELSSKKSKKRNKKRKRKTRMKRTYHSRAS